MYDDLTICKTDLINIFLKTDLQKTILHFVQEKMVCKPGQCKMQTADNLPWVKMQTEVIM